MSTRSNIGIITQKNDGKVRVEMIYCHWDGYPSNNGKILLENYSSTEKVRELLKLGDLSSLGSEIGTKHDFDTHPERQCNFYKRDRGEKGVSSQKNLTIAKAREMMEVSLYLWDAKFESWFYCENGGALLPLTQKACKEV
jgi:hypothetical protein